MQHVSTVKGNHQYNTKKHLSWIIKTILCSIKLSWLHNTFFTTSSQVVKLVKYFPHTLKKVLVLAVFLKSWKIAFIIYVNILVPYFQTSIQFSWSTTFTVHKYITCTHTHAKIHQNFTKTKAPNIYNNT